jgi:alanyl-tRNA synthetase
LGSHVQQAGSLVAPDRLRFDFSHFEAVTRDQLDEIEARSNEQVLTDAPVRHYETTKEHAESLGAIAFFGDKYGDLVRVLEAGESSIELCGGTHVHALGFIGPIKIVSEGSIGANLRRIEAVTGDAALAHIHREEVLLREIADRLNVAPNEVSDRLERLLAEVKDLRGELEGQRRGQAAEMATALAAGAVDGVVVVRQDGLSNDEIRGLAIATRDALGSGVVGIVGVAPDGAKASIAVAVGKDLVEHGANAGEIAAEAAKALGGGTGKQADVVAGGGPNANAVDEALALLERRAKEAAANAAGSN